MRYLDLRMPSSCNLCGWRLLVAEEIEDGQTSDESVLMRTPRVGTVVVEVELGVGLVCGLVSDVIILF